MVLETILEGIRPHLRSIHPGSKVWLAYSGGLDSSVLLHCVKILQVESSDFQLTAIHVHHGLQEAADDWVNHCHETCEHLGVELVVQYVNARAPHGESPEAVARSARYQAMASKVQPGDYLLTAHHRDDQAETFLLQLMRGSGVSGLAAMAAESDFHSAKQLRPLLTLTREQIRTCALELGLDWIEDSSNDNLDFDRNFIRHEIMSLLQQRWPSAAGSIARSAAHMAETTTLLAELAELDLEQVAVAGRPRVLKVSGLKALAPHRQRNLLRYWLRKQGCLMPSSRKMEHILNDVLYASKDANPLVAWSDVAIRRYRDLIYFLSATRTDIPMNGRIVWDLRGDLVLQGLGCLSLQSGVGKGLRADIAGNAEIMVGFRKGGEKLKPAGRSHTHELRKLLQEKGIPPWERKCLPILYADGVVIAVPGVCIVEGFQARETEPGMELIWHPE